MEAPADPEAAVPADPEDEAAQIFQVFELREVCRLECTSLVGGNLFPTQESLTDLGEMNGAPA